MPWGSQTTTSKNTVNNEPWGPVQEPLTKAIDNIDPLIGQTQYFRPPTNPQFQDSFNLMQLAAQDANYGRDHWQNPTSTESNLNPLMAASHYDTSVGGSQLGQFAQQGQNPYDQNIANNWNQWQSHYNNPDNPYLDQVIADSGDDVMDALNQQFTGAGRSYGSGAYGRAAGDRVGRMATQMRFQDYQTRDARERAAFQNAQGRGFDAANQLYGQGGNRLLQGAPLQDAAHRTRVQDIDRTNKDRAMLMLEQALARQGHDDEQGNQATLQAAGWPIGLLSGAGAQFGTQTSRGTQTSPNQGFWPGIGALGLGIAKLWP